MKVVISTVFAVITVGLAITAQSQSNSVKQSGAKFQPLNIKPGLWEMTYITATSGAAPIPAETLARLTPAQRARVEEQMKARASGLTTTEKTCIAKRDLENPEFVAGRNCTYSVVSSSAAAISQTYSCESNGANMSGKSHVEAVDQEHIKGSLQGTNQSTGKGGAYTMNMDATFSAKWLGSSCEEKSEQE